MENIGNDTGPDTSSFIVRKRKAKGFQYFYSTHKRLTGSKQLKRIKAMVIPPMWEDVLIAKDSAAKIQASGRDAKGRKQYIYSEQWQQMSQAQKFLKLNDFAKQLPSIRTHCHALLKQNEWTPEKVLSLMVLVLDHTGIRIGNKHYAKNNQTYGLSTLRRKHIVDNNDGITLEFIGKSGKARTVHIDDDALASQINQSSEQPGYSIFRYKETANRWSDVTSDEVNAFIKANMGDEFSCKDFRTWTGTCLAVKHYCHLFNSKEGKVDGQKLQVKVVKAVAKELGNTPAICREYYIHPKVLSAIGLQRVNIEKVCAENFDAHTIGLSSAEQEVLSLIEK